METQGFSQPWILGLGGEGLLWSYCRHVIDSEEGVGVSWAPGPVAGMCLWSSLTPGPAVFSQL